MSRAGMALIAAALLFTFAVCAPAAPGPQATQAVRPSAPRPLLRGHVYSAETGRPLKHAVLTLARPGSADKGSIATTGAEGTFEFSGVAPGRYLLRCERNGYLRTSYGGDSPQPLSLGAGEQVSIDFRLLRGGVITGVVRGEDGEPMAGLQVQAILPQQPDAAMSALLADLQADLQTRALAAIRSVPRFNTALAITDDRGVYRLARLAPGAYYVRVGPGGLARGPEYNLNPLPPLFYPDVPAMSEARSIEVKSGVEVSGIDFRLRRIPSFHISGRVIVPEAGAANQPERSLAVPGGGRSIISLSPVDFASLGTSALAQPDGSFTISPVFPGRYRLSVSSSGLGGARATRTIDVSADVDGLVIELSPGAAIKGKLILEGGTLPAGAAISVYIRGQEPADQPLQYGNRLVGARPPNFEFQIPGLEAGEYELGLSGSGPLSGFYLREVRANGRPVDLVQVAPGSPVDVELVLGSGLGTLTGVLRNEADQPIVGRVVLHAAEPAQRVLQRYFKSESTDQNGRFEITGLAPGDYLLIGWPADVEPAGALDPAILARLEKFAVRVRIPSGGTVEQDVKLSPEAATMIRAADK